eukprot:scaffold128_cov248-Pinguiococcus_pyrenoidosus.AAC.45
MGHLQARIAIAEVGHVVDLRWSQACQRLRALIVLHFRHVVHAAGVEGLLDPLAALLREVRQLEKLALRLPNPHGDALEQLHTAQGRLQEAAGRRDVHESADELGDELAHLLRIRLHLGRQPETRDVRTKKPRNARGAGRERHGDVLRHPRESARVVQVRADALQFRRRRDNLEHAAQLRLRLDTGGEDLYAIVRNAVVRGDHAEVQTDEVAVVFHRDAAALLQVSHGVLHQLGQVLADAFVGGSGDAVVVWILGHTPIEQRPREPVHRVILALDDLVLNVRVQVVVHALVEVRLDRERVAQHLAQEVLLVRVGKDVSAALVVDVRPAGAAHHVQKIRHAVVHQPVASRVVLLRSHDADQVCTQLKIPRHRRRAHHNSNHAIALLHAESDEANTAPESLSQGRVLDGGQHPLQAFPDLVFRAQEVHVGASRIGEDVHGRELTLLAARHEDQAILVAALCTQRPHDAEERLRHGQHHRRVVPNLEAVQLDHEGLRSDAGVEVEEPLAGDAQPGGDVGRVRQRSSQTDHSDRQVRAAAGLDEAHPGQHDLKLRTELASEQVQAIADDETDLQDDVALAPLPRDHIPGGGAGHHNLRRVQGRDVLDGVASLEHAHLDAAVLQRPRH